MFAIMFVMAETFVPAGPKKPKKVKKNDSIALKDTVASDTLVSVPALDTTKMDSLQLAIYHHNKAIDDSIRLDSINRSKKNGIDAPVNYKGASCESYIGDLKENNTYVPWNRYPNKEGEKLYRLGNGFSKMLQMIQVDENDKKNTGVQNDLNNNISKTDGNNNNNTERNLNNSKESKKKSLPRIRNKNKMMNRTKSYFNNNTGLNTISPEIEIYENDSTDKVHTIEVDKREEEFNEPKITKIYRLNKDSN